MCVIEHNFMHKLDVICLRLSEQIMSVSHAHIQANVAKYSIATNTQVQFPDKPLSVDYTLNYKSFREQNIYKVYAY